MEKFREIESKTLIGLKVKIKKIYGLEGLADFYLSLINISAEEIYNEYQNGAFFSDLAKKYNLSEDNIVTIFDGKKLKKRTSSENTKLFNQIKLKEVVKAKYGVENVFQLNSTKEKIKQTNLEKYGSEYYSSTVECKEKVKQTSLKKFGSENVFSSDYGKEKIKQSLVEKYGSIDNAYKNISEKQRKTIIEKYGSFESFFKERNLKTEETNLKKYGKKNVFQVEEVKEKIKQTNLQKYKVENPQKCKEIREKTKQTCIEKYGVDNYSKTEEFCKKRKKKFTIDGENFNSSWELAFYIYHRDLGEKVEHEVSFFEFEFNGRIYKYFPDFKINNTFYEIKGNHFFDKNEKMINPFDRSQDDIYEAKHQCGLKNGVIFLKENDLKKELEYLNEKYSNFLK